MPRKLSLKDKLLLIGLALLANICFFGLLPLIDWLGGDVKKWFGFVLFTGLVFGVGIYVYAKDLKTIRSILVFVALFVIHVAACVVYLRVADRFPSLFFLVFAPIEVGIVELVLTTAGGVRPRLRPQRRSRRTEEIDHVA